MSKENKNKSTEQTDKKKSVDETQVEALARIIESTGGNCKVSEENQKIIHLFANGDIDYETAVLAIKRNFSK